MPEQSTNHSSRVDEVRAVAGKVEAIGAVPLVLRKQLSLAVSRCVRGIEMCVPNMNLAQHELTSSTSCGAA